MVHSAATFVGTPSGPWRYQKRGRWLLSVSLIALTVSARAAHADNLPPSPGAAASVQTPAGQAAPSQAPAVEEVVVTATKRRENLRHVPQSISAISSTQLKNRQITSFDDVARAVPGLAITSLDRPGQADYFRNIDYFGAAKGIDDDFGFARTRHEHIAY